MKPILDHLRNLSTKVNEKEKKAMDAAERIKEMAEASREAGLNAKSKKE